MKKRLLAILLVLAMATLLVPTAALAAEEDVVAKIGDKEYTSLQAAVNALNAIEGTNLVTMEIMPGEHDVTVDESASDGTANYGSCFIIQRDNVVITANDPSNKPVLYGFTNELNANIETDDKSQMSTGQDTIYIDADNVKLENLIIMPLGNYVGNGNEAFITKAVEVVSADAGSYNFTMTGCTICANDKSKGEAEPYNKGEAGRIYLFTDSAILENNIFDDGTIVTAAEGYAVDASENYWGDEVTPVDIANRIVRNVKVDTYYTDKAMETEPVELGGIPVANAEQLQAAMDAAANETNTSICLVDDIELTAPVKVPEKEITVNGGGHSISFEGGPAFSNIDAQNLAGIFSNTTLAVNDVRFINTTETPQGYAVLINHDVENTAVELSGCTFKNLYCGVYSNQVVTEGHGAEVTIIDCTYDGTTYGYSVDEITNGAIVGAVRPTFENNQGIDEDHVFENWEDDNRFVATVSSGGVTKAYQSWDAAYAAAQDDDTITLAQDVSLANDLLIEKDITIDGQDKYTLKISPNPSHAISIADGAALTFKDVRVEITGESGYGIDVRYGAAINLDNADVVITGVSNATISSASDAATPGAFNFTNGSTITATDIGGNFSNGGNWTLTDSSITIDGCTSHGLSCDDLTMDASSVRVRNTGLVGVTPRDVTLRNGATIVVENCGTDLPKPSQWATDKESYKYPVEIKSGSVVEVDNSSSIVLNGNKEDVIYLVESTLDNAGIVDAEVRTKAPTGTFAVTVMNGDTVIDVANIKDGDTYTLPAGPSRAGYHFVGWLGSDGEVYAAGGFVEISSDMVFTAQWQEIAVAPDRYYVTIEGAVNGAVTATPSQAEPGETVTVTVTPDEGYALEAISVADAQGNALSLNELGNGQYSFVMPQGTATVTASFVKEEAPAPVLPFVDVTEEDWFYEAVVYAYENGLMEGDGTEYFQPGQTVTRAMMAQLLYNLEGRPSVSGEAAFSDVAEDQWYYAAIQWASANGVVKGYEDDTFQPEKAITREELAQLFYNYERYKGGDLSASGDLSIFTDADQVSSWAEEALSWAVGADLMHGKGDGVLDPAGASTRAEIAQLMLNYGA